MQPTRLWFLRHGETDAGERWVGRTESGLTALGRHQAEAIAAYLEPAEVDAIVASPRRRALDTAAPLARSRSLRLEVRREWAEMDFGAWEGLTWEGIVARDAAFAAQWVEATAETPCPGGESANGFASRIAAALEGLCAEFAGRSVVLSGHAGTSRAILAAALGLPYMTAMRIAQDHGAVNAAAWSPAPSVVLVNFVPGPRSEPTSAAST